MRWENVQEYSVEIPGAQCWTREVWAACWTATWRCVVLEFWGEIRARYRDVGVTSIYIILKVMRLEEITKKVDLETWRDSWTEPGALQYCEVKEMEGKGKNHDRAGRRVRERVGMCSPQSQKKTEFQGKTNCDWCTDRSSKIRTKSFHLQCVVIGQLSEWIQWGQI